MSLSPLLGLVRFHLLYFSSAILLRFLPVLLHPALPPTPRWLIHLPAPPILLMLLLIRLASPSCLADRLLWPIRASLTLLLPK